MCNVLCYNVLLNFKRFFAMTNERKIDLNIYLTPVLNVNGQFIEIAPAFNGNHADLETKYDGFSVGSKEELDDIVNKFFVNGEFDGDLFQASNLSSNQVQNLTNEITKDSEWVNDILKVFDIESKDKFLELLEFSVSGVLEINDIREPINYNDI